MMGIIMEPAAPDKRSAAGCMKDGRLGTLAKP